MKTLLIPGTHWRHKKSGVVYWMRSSTGYKFELEPVVRTEEVSKRILMRDYVTCDT
jgi:hypothetical protein